MIGDLLHKANFLVKKPTTAANAGTPVHIKQIAESENRPVTDYVQVVISDIEMPNMDGHNLTKRIKEDPVLKQLQWSSSPPSLPTSCATRARRWARTTRSASRNHPGGPPRGPTSSRAASPRRPTPNAARL
jgi:CheY-like chemotaxis protein